MEILVIYNWFWRKCALQSLGKFVFFFIVYWYSYVSLSISSQNLYALGPYVLLTPTLCRPKMCGCIWYCFLSCPLSGVVHLYIMQKISNFLIVSLIINSLVHLSCWNFLSSLFLLVVVGFFHSWFFKCNLVCFHIYSASCVVVIVSDFNHVMFN